jgi:hypothetical protein
LPFAGPCVGRIVTYRRHYSGWKNHDHSDPPRLVSGIILLGAYAARLEFPELKTKARKMYDKWKPIRW